MLSTILSVQGLSYGPEYDKFGDYFLCIWKKKVYSTACVCECVCVWRKVFYKCQLDWLGLYYSGHLYASLISILVTERRVEIFN